jgi:hypothetical protein
MPLSLAEHRSLYRIEQTVVRVGATVADRPCAYHGDVFYTVNALQKLFD